MHNPHPSPDVLNRLFFSGLLRSCGLKSRLDPDINIGTVDSPLL